MNKGFKLSPEEEHALAEYSKFKSKPDLKPKSTNKKIHIPIYRVWVHVFHSHTADNLHEEIYKKYKVVASNIIGSNSAASTLFPEEGSKYPNLIIVLYPNNTDPNIYSSVHHESIHAATKILDMRGVPISQENDEALTYLSMYIFEETCKTIGLKLTK